MGGGGGAMKDRDLVEREREREGVLLLDEKREEGDSCFVTEKPHTRQR